MNGRRTKSCLGHCLLALTHHSCGGGDRGSLALSSAATRLAEDERHEVAYSARRAQGLHTPLQKAGSACQEKRAGSEIRLSCPHCGSQRIRLERRPLLPGKKVAFSRPLSFVAHSRSTNASGVLGSGRRVLAAWRCAARACSSGAKKTDKQTGSAVLRRRRCMRCSGGVDETGVGAPRARGSRLPFAPTLSCISAALTAVNYNGGLLAR